MRFALTIFVASLLVPAEARADRKKSPEQRQRDELRDAQRRLARELKTNGTSPELDFVRERATELIELAAAQPPKSYKYDRLEAAIDDLLDAGEHLAELLRHGDRKDTEGRAKTARELEGTYFRVTQAEYFAGLSKDPHAREYVRLARGLYQSARREYDAERYWRARRFSDASSEIVQTLESLAQSEVRIPTPPELR